MLSALNVEIISCIWVFEYWVYVVYEVYELSIWILES